MLRSAGVIGGAGGGGGGSALPSFADIGATGTAGSYSFSAGTHTLVSYGTDIWSDEDSGSFAYQPLTGDGTVTARVASVQNTGSWAKAGVMIRESLSAGSPHAMALITPANGANFVYRTASFGLSSIANGNAVSAPYWVRVVRSGTTLTGYQSADGSSWTSIGSVTISMAAGVYVGLALSSNVYNTQNTSTFDNVSVS